MERYMGKFSRILLVAALMTVLLGVGVWRLLPAASSHPAHAQKTGTPNHINMIAAQSAGVDGTLGTGCKSPQNMVLNSLTTGGNSYWSYTCYNIPSIPQELDSAGISWRYYSSTPIWNAPYFVKPLYPSDSSH